MSELHHDEDEVYKLFRRSDPDTSEEAAEAIWQKLRRLQAEVYVYFVLAKRATQLDVENYFNDHGSSYRSRVPELCEKRLLRYSGMKVEQKGRNRRIYELVEREKT